MYEDEDTSWSFTIGVFVGALAGAAAASLLTPRSGRQNREVVLEKGLVLKGRVTSTTSSMTSGVKETTNSAVASVKDATNSAVTKVSDTVTTVREKAHVAAETVTGAAGTAVTRVSETASATVEKLQEAASTAAETVSTVASTATERVSSVASTAAETVSTVASTATERVSSVASTAVESVSSVASTAAEKVSTVTSSAADKVHELTARGQETAEATAPAPSASVVASEARYDAEDVRPAISGAAPAGGSTTSTATSGVADTSANPQALHVLSSIDTFKPTMADMTASTTIEPEALALEDTAPEASTADIYSSQFGSASTTAAQTELRSDEQFEVNDLTVDEQSQTRTGTVGGSDPDVRDTSEGAERGA